METDEAARAYGHSGGQFGEPNFRVLLCVILLLCDVLLCVIRCVLGYYGGNVGVVRYC